LIFSFGFYSLSFKHVFWKKSFKFDLSSFTFIGKYVVINIISLEPQNFEHSCNCSFTLALKDDIFKKYWKTKPMFWFQFMCKVDFASRLFEGN
jgi:hypothetical protein